ncbi:hypothetical protein LOD99_12641 [Oopsacas minuta]|uniref:Uncharacterized protein n=1 Tax=Oopsacas minuta TaxID=111878 RepID=A0AAV7JDI0_9METZ|nr:hypothetical protein LOD99_12641 [Oopsacas minuta]
MIVSGKFRGKKRNFRKRVSDSLGEGGDPTQDTDPVSIVQQAPTHMLEITSKQLDFQTHDSSNDEDSIEPVKLKRTSHSRKMTKDSLTHKAVSEIGSARDLCNTTGSLEIDPSRLELDTAPIDEVS